MYISIFAYRCYQRRTTPHQRNQYQYTRAYTHTHTHIYIYIHKYVWIYSHVCVQRYVRHGYMHTYEYIYINAKIQICIYICVCVHAHAIIYLYLSIFTIGPGSNCKSDWDKFSRQCLDRKRFPISLAAHYQRDKLDLFRSWLSANEDWSKPLVFNSTSAHNIKRPKWVCPQGRKMKGEPLHRLK